jgi:hypothetical protein
MLRRLPKTDEEFAAAWDPEYERPIADAIKQYYGLPVSKGTVRFLITSAQNATPLSLSFWESLLHCQQYYSAHLSVIPYRYKNPTSRWTGSQQGAEYWVKEVREYLNNQRRNLNTNLMVLGDIKIVPTAKDPLRDQHGYSGAESSIAGHPNLAFETVPVPGHKMAKIMATTGSCTVPNYTDSRQGKAGEFQHVIGAMLVEIEGGKFWLRHLNATKDGSFMDKDKWFTPDGVKDAPPPEAVVLGDAHVRQNDKTVERGLWGSKGLVTVLKPKRQFWHDVLDGSTVNPYGKGQPFSELAKKKAGLDKVEEELNEAADFVIHRTPEGCESIIVDSNHDQFLRRWLETKHWTEVGLNGGVYFELGHHVWQGTHMPKDDEEFVPSPFEFWVRRRAEGKACKITCLREDQSYKVFDIECGMHGHRGTNGARGSLRNLAKIGVKFIIGHVHSPGIRFGGMAVGLIARLRMGYNKGPSSWLHTIAVVYANGKRQLVTLIEGRPWL